MPLNTAFIIRLFLWCLGIKLWFIFQLKSTREKSLKGKKKFSLRNLSTILVELKCLLKASSAPAFQQLHICAFCRPSKYFKNEFFIKQMTSRHSSRFFTGEKLKFMDFHEAAFDSCASKAHRMRKELHFIVNHSAIWSSIQFYLFFPFIFSSFPDLYFFVPIVTFHLSPSNKMRREWEKHLESLAQHSLMLVGSINVWTATKYLLRFVYSGLSFFTSFFGQSKET